MKVARKRIFALEVTIDAWEVREGDPSDGHTEDRAVGPVLGFIEKSCGFYEVECLNGKPRQRYCASFQEAMDFFEIER